jgi:tetratricopeptide (TPR) repeat protein
LRRILSYLAGVLALTALILYAWPTPTIFYESILALHLAMGALLVVLGIPLLGRLLKEGSSTQRIGWLVLLIGGVLGAIILYSGARRQDWGIVYSHVLISLLACAILFSAFLARRGWLASGARRAALRTACCLLLFAGIAAASWWVRTVPWQRAYVIENPRIAPASMDGEGAGPNGPFFPSSGQTATGKTVPEDFFLDSQACERCHQDIYKQWQSSMHHFSSFNNQWYRQAIVYMQDTIGVRSSKWCAGCHDAALFFPGNFNTPIASRVHTVPAQAGIGCMVCHSFVQIKSTMGNGDYTLEYPPLNRLVATKNPILRRLIDYMIEEDPEPHRRTFLKPFMRAQTAEYCSVCHKVHLDVPVNNYRWTRGFDDYDNWQASGVSGFGARSFYYPPKPQNCADCHMTLTPSQDAGNIDGFVHSHRFIAANTAVPFANKDQQQLDDVEKFLESGLVRVDIFAMSRENASLKPEASSYAPGQQPGIETEFAVGEESEMKSPAGPVPTAPPTPITAPLNRVNASVRAGGTVRIDVVVRTLKVGHFFPGGTVDAFDCWLELKATDDQGRVIFWSGGVEDGGDGPVDPGAHFYRALLIDSHGNPITRRNAWAARATVYAHLIPPGAADTAHFRLRIPRDEKGHIHLEAKLNYRKFMWVNTQFSFAGVLHNDHPSDFAPDYDDRRITYNGDTAGDSEKISGIPNLPIITMASSTADLVVLPPNSPEPAPVTSFDAKEWQRWNDYGIGLLLQGDLKGAESAFEELTQKDPSNPDGWVNVGRARVLEGDLAGARQVLDKALQLSPSLARAHYFYSRVLTQTGDYDGAIKHLQAVLEQYPEDRVVNDDLGRIYFLQHKYAQAIQQFQKTLAIDPEDLEANYNLMLCYNGLGDAPQSKAFETRYLRFKADEASQTLTGPYREKHPDDNLERQPIHEHESGDIAAFLAKTAAPAEASSLSHSLTSSRLASLRKRPASSHSAPQSSSARSVPVAQGGAE